MEGTTLEHTSDERALIPEINELVCTRRPGRRRNDHGLKSVIISDERDYFRDFPAHGALQPCSAPLQKPCPLEVLSRYGHD